MRIRRSEGRAIGRASAVAALVLSGALARAQQPAGEPDAQEAIGLFPIEDETLLVVRDVPGMVLVSVRKEREVRFVSRAKDKSGSERPIGVWFEANTVVLAPLPGAPTPDGILRIEIPGGFGLRMEPSGGTTGLDGLTGVVEVRAKDTEVRCRSITGTLQVSLERGVLRLNEVSGATIRAKDAVVEGTGVQGPLSARLEGTTKLTVSDVQGALDIESDGAAIVTRGIEGPVRLRARGGTADLGGLEAGGELHLAGCPLKMQEGKGDITVSSDATVAFEKMAASLHFDLYGGSLQGRENQGLVEVRTRNTEIGLEAIDGPLRIQGDGLKVNVSGVTGEVFVEAAVSEVTLAKASGAVGLKIEQGPVTVQGAGGLLSATVIRGDARLIDLTGPVALEIDGGNAEVSWTSITGDTDTLLQNTSGDVTVRFPGNASCRVEAKSKYGRIESDLPTVRVLEDGKEAQGPIGFGRRPTIKVEAEGDVRLFGGGASTPPPSE